jgi:hypothetical protein
VIALALLHFQSPAENARVGNPSPYLAMPGVDPVSLDEPAHRRKQPVLSNADLLARGFGHQR